VTPGPGPRRRGGAQNGPTGDQPIEVVVPVELDQVLDPAAEAEAQASHARAEAERRRRERTLLRDIRAGQQTALEAVRQGEAKATSLLGLFGAALAAALVLATHTEPMRTATMVFLALATGPLLGAVIVLLDVLRARLGGDHGFCRWAIYHRHPEALIDHLSLPPNCQLDIQARRLADLSALAVAKFRRINLAIAFLAAGLPLLALAALTA
jgi:hypothetical protein